MLPRSLYALSEKDRMAVAWACEAHHVLQTQVATFDRKARQMLFAARNYQLQTVEATSRLRTVTQQVDILIKDAIEKIRALEVTRGSEASKCSAVDLQQVRLEFESLGNNNITSQ
jgi:hypothetical protein